MHNCVLTENLLVKHTVQTYIDADALWNLDLKVICELTHDALSKFKH